MLAPCNTARADALRAVLIAPSTRDELLDEALAMVRGELSAAGFRVTVQRSTQANQTNASIAPVVDQDAGFAVVVVRRQPREGSEVDALEFWVYEPWGRETAVVRSPVDAGEPSLSARRGAVQAVEVLRAVLAQRGIAQKVDAEDQPRREVDTGPRSEHREQDLLLGSVRIGVGLAVWSGFEGLGSSLTPTATLSVTLPESLPSRDLVLDLRASAAGLGPPCKLEFDEGTVRVRQFFFIGELVLRLWPRDVVQPLLSVGGGAYAVSIEAEAVAPFISRSPHTWSALFGVGIGLMLAFSTHFAASLEARLLSAAAPSDLSVAGSVEAVAGAPMLLTGAQLIGAF